MSDRRARVFDQNPLCPFCQEAEGTASHTLYDCPAFAQREEPKLPPPREGIPQCVRVFGLRIQSPTVLLTIEEPPPRGTQEELLFPIAVESIPLSPRTGVVAVA
eukprot:6477767-Amphidinium_carterae.2